MQKFKKGDLVQVAEDLGKSMSHFTSGCRAIVIGSYADQFGGKNTKSYTLYIHKKGTTSWYCEDQLTLLAKGQLELLAKWKQEASEEAAQSASIDWIFANGQQVLEGANGSTVQALADDLGLKGSLWGSQGEGYVYHMNALRILGLAKPYLNAGDKEGWLKFCQENKDKGK